MREYLAHLLFPRPSNNHRAALLHHRILLGCTILLFTLSLFLGSIRKNFPEILGTSIDISIQQLLELTNRKREEQGLPPLTINQHLADAASLKARDMFTKDYWAHRAPDGKTPWVFIKQAGYEYAYAGENLARGFTNASDVVNAWMASETHRENVISPNYRDIGFAVEKGALSGEDTILVVQMFGNQNLSVAPQKQAAPGELAKPVQYPANQRVAGSRPLIDGASLSRRVAVVVLTLFISVFAFDMIIIERRKIARFVGHNLDHAFFLGMILIIALIVVGRGVIL